jgi:transposase-like protein
MELLPVSEGANALNQNSFYTYFSLALEKLLDETINMGSEEKIRIRKNKFKPIYKINCQNCKQEVFVYRFGGMSDVFPHFYCDSCSNVFFSKRYRNLLMKEKLSEKIANEIFSSLPHCSCGGFFSKDAYPKCPHCTYKLLDIFDPIARLSDPHAIILKHAYLMTEE